MRPSTFWLRPAPPPGARFFSAPRPPRPRAPANPDCCSTSTTAALRQLLPARSLRCAESLATELSHRPGPSDACHQVLQYGPASDSDHSVRAAAATFASTEWGVVLQLAPKGVWGGGLGPLGGDRPSPRH